MKTDKELFKIFRAHPNLLRDLIGLANQFEYDFRSEEMKDFSRRADGILLSPQDPWAYILEFQAYKSEDIYFRIAVEQALFAQHHREKKVAMVLIFFNRQWDPRTEPWHGLCHSANPYFRAFYLTDLVAQLSEKRPNHPLVLLFQPILADRGHLRRNARNYYQRLEAEVSRSQSLTYLLDIFGRWMLQRFAEVSEAEVMAMFNLTPLEETRGYRDLVARGKAIGEKRGLLMGEIQGQIKLLESLRHSAKISESDYLSMIEPLRAQLAKLEK